MNRPARLSQFAGTFLTAACSAVIVNVGVSQIVRKHGIPLVPRFKAQARHYHRPEQADFDAALDWLGAFFSVRVSVLK
jgi:hypothetical protein